VAAFDGRLPGHSTGVGAVAVSEPPWHAHCSDASANGKGHIWRGRSNTHVLHSIYIDPADPPRRYWLIAQEVSPASCCLVDAVMVGVQEGARARRRSPDGDLDCLQCRQSHAVAPM